MNEKIKHIVLLVHGVHTKKNKGWLSKFIKQYKKDFADDPEWHAETLYYGNVLFFYTLNPFFIKHKINKVEEKLKEVQIRYPNAKIHVIAHSFGSHLVYEAIRQSDIYFDKNPIYLGKFITIGGIINHNEKFIDTVKEDQIEEIHNFCSYKDYIIKWQPLFGKSGFSGFLKYPNDQKHYFKPKKNLRVYNHRYNVRHSEYFSDNPPDFYSLWANILLGKEK